MQLINGGIGFHSVHVGMCINMLYIHSVLNINILTYVLKEIPDDLYSISFLILKH